MFNGIAIGVGYGGFGGSAPTPYVGFLDLYPGAAVAFSLRKLRSDYSGSAIQVRRSSDNATQNIGFTSSGDLDVSGLTSFCGEGNGFVTTWYDQSGSAINVSQSSGLNQPQIVSSGSVLTRSGKPTILFDGSNDTLIASQPLPINNGPLTLISVAYTTLNAGYYFIAGGADFATPNGSQYANALIPGKFYFELKSSPFASDIQVNKTVSHFLLVGIADGSTQYLYVNGSANSKSISLTYAPSTLNFSIGAASIGGSYFNGEINEVITYGSSKLSDISSINNNIDTYYGIY
jgi:hypothetical protein